MTQTAHDPMPCTVRQAMPSDDAALARLFALYHEEFAYSLGNQDVRGEGARARAYYATGTILVAELNGEVIGCVALEPWDPPRCRMKRMIVDPTFRGQGLGRALASAIQRAASDAGFTEMCLDTTEPMQAARTLYGRMGFMEYAPDYEAPCRDVLYMRKSL